MVSVLVRIGLRYIAAVLVARGFLTADDGSVFAADPDLAMLIETSVGFAVGGITEAWWWFTKASSEAEEVGRAVDKGQKVTVEGPRGGETVHQKAVL